ncbi:unnamed protein product [Porites evermanni]|uniref:Sulfatase N-terminal domain-containing protein n=1 Tax=Porites evermanni TaxID=104178 RepID=A0ABN8PE78_9CNID|nr:unnamed protein product [Porites evermanni]
MTSQDYMASSRVVPRFLVLGIFVLFCSICWADAQAYQRAQKPHIIMIVADDLGWDDVSFHGSPQIPTPTLDGLAESGVILNNYYVSPMDSPTRAAFMTGKYALNLGLQHDTIHNKQPFGLPLKEKLLPEYLRQMGYSTHAVGKWQLGFFAKEFTPTYRGFDSFYGFWTSGQDYFSHVTYDGSYGLDLRRDLAVVYNETGTYGTELFTREADKVINDHDDSKPLFLYFAQQAVHVGNDNEPLQVPKKYLDRLSYIGDEKRRTYAGMVSALDESVRQIVTTLKRKGLYDNSIIIFTTDNGAAAGGLDSSAGSNFPLRGAKNTLWEGGVRGVGFVHSPLIKKRGRVSTALLHASDWFPTFYTLAGGNVKSLGAIDGFNVWDTISNDAQSPRYEILHGLDSLKEKKAAIRIGDYKMIVHQNRSFYSDWYPRPESLHELDQVPKPSLLKDASVDCTVRHPHPLLYTKAPICNPEKKPCLFNIKWDPCEYHNLADFMPNTLKVMIDRLKFYARKSAPTMYPQADESANPDQHGGVWTPWREKTDVDQTMNDYVYPYSYYDSPKPKPSGPPKNQLDQFMRDQGLAGSDKANTYPEVEDIIINFREHNMTEGRSIAPAIASRSLLPNDVQSVIRHNGFTKHLASSHVEEVSMLPPVKSPETLAHKPAMFSSHAHKGDTLPEILDIIDEPAVPNAYAAGGSGQEETIPKIFDIIDEAHKQGSQVKELSSQQQGPIATSKPLTSNDVGSGMGVGLTGLPDGISVFGKLGDQKILSKSHETGEGREHIVAKEKPSKGKKKANVHKFIGNITIDGRRYLVVGTETEESDSVSSHMEGNTITLHLPKSKKPHSHDEKSKGKDKSAEDADSKSEIGGFRAPSEPGIGEITDYIDDDELGTEKPTNKTLAAHNITAVATTGNNTKCEKVVQLDTSDNAVVVSSVVIVVIASAMVVGVAVVAMVAVVARHCQNARN